MQWQMLANRQQTIIHKETQMKLAHLMTIRSRSLKIALATILLAGASLPQVTLAQAYPTKPVRIIVPAAPGGGIDLAARSFSDKLSELWGQRVFVENRPGANFVIGSDAVAKSAPDGYTLLLTSYGAITVNPLAYSNLPYNPQRDLAPIMLATTAPFVLLANKNLPVNSMQDLIKHLRANPGKLNHASNSASTILASELFKSLTQVNYVDINYKGGILAAASTSAGDTDFALVDLGSATASMQGGRARALAVSTAKRSKLYPDIPTFAESGVPGYSVDAWLVLLAPAKTPPAIIAKVNADLKRVLAMPEVVTRIESIGNEVVASSPEEASRALAADAEKWTRLVKERNIKFP
jgi:tripartite-type tricarboxylate transporter receptor subunit TctC